MMHGQKNNKLCPLGSFVKRMSDESCVGM